MDVFVVLSVTGMISYGLYSGSCSGNSKFNSGTRT